MQRQKAVNNDAITVKTPNSYLNKQYLYEWSSCLHLSFSIETTIFFLLIFQKGIPVLRKFSTLPYLQCHYTLAQQNVALGIVTEGLFYCNIGEKWRGGLWSRKGRTKHRRRCISLYLQNHIMEIIITIKDFKR